MPVIIKLTRVGNHGLVSLLAAKFREGNKFRIRASLFPVDDCDSRNSCCLSSDKLPVAIKQRLQHAMAYVKSGYRPLGKEFMHCRCGKKKLRYLLRAVHSCRPVGIEFGESNRFAVKK